MVSDSQSPSNDSDGGGDDPHPHSYTETFYEYFPMCLVYGMTYDQYWNDDPSLVKYYRKAYDMKREIKNEELWLQGMYVYEAIADISPILHAFAKAGTKAHPYPKEPYPITKMREKAQIEKREQKGMEEGIKCMEMIMANVNQAFQNKSP